MDEKAHDEDIHLSTEIEAKNDEEKTVEVEVVALQGIISDIFGIEAKNDLLGF